MSLKAKIEAVIYAADEPVTLAQLAAIFAEEALAAGTEAALPFGSVEGNHAALVDIFDASEMAQATDATEEPALPMEDAEAKKQARVRDREARAAIQKIVDELIAEYASGDRGMEIREIAGGYRIATKAEYHDAVRTFVKGQKPQMKLSLQALETLAVVAYKQPVTAPEISEIRGVDTSGVLGGLMARKLITTAGRKQVIGRPILYKTTREFLLRFGLKDVSELPSIEEFEKMAADMAEDMGDADEMKNSSLDAESATDTVTDEISAPEADPGSNP
ncbi:MAG: SMC-Scp complex subunit ScpB [Acidobacteriaceae bacterium]